MLYRDVDQALGFYGTTSDLTAKKAEEEENEEERDYEEENNALQSSLIQASSLYEGREKFPYRLSHM